MIKIFFRIVFFLVLFNCSKEDGASIATADAQPAPKAKTETQLETSQEIVQFTLTVNTSVGGSISQKVEPMMREQKYK